MSTYISDEVLLNMLEVNLEILTDYMDTEAVTQKETELRWYIDAAKEFIALEGITIADTIGDATLIVMYAGWLYDRRKAGPDQPMPRMLRWNLNNRIYAEHLEDE